MYFLKRLAFLVPLLLVISALAFGLMKLAPGSPFDRDRVPATPDVERALKARYHYDEPVWKQWDEKGEALEKIHRVVASQGSGVSNQ